MPIQPNGRKFLVTVNRAAAKEGYQRIRKAADTYKEAQDLEREIEAALTAYGMWPVPATQEPLSEPLEAYRHADTNEYRNPTHKTGTLREAARIALETHWHGMRSAKSVEPCLWRMVYFFEALGKYDIDMMVSADLHAFVKKLREGGNSPSFINQQLSHFHIVNEIASKQTPALCTIVLSMPREATRIVEKWWLRPEDQDRVSTWLRDPLSTYTDAMFADLIDFICYQGLRVEEALRLEPRLFTGLNGKDPWLQPDGTKTVNAQNSIPVFPEAAEVAKRAVARAIDNRWDKLFPITPRQAADRWGKVRAFLQVEHIPTATMKALRRTFAWYANDRGMPTATLQRVMRHRQISTTAGYLELIGGGDLSRSREYFRVEQPEPEAPKGSNVGEIIKAYVATGASPEDVARFARELMV
ncbi:tyrosine-type recombinase/integrase [Mesorhizobium sp. B2-8-3]|uniref:tyrosine-type recombinase/integrase n=1 Tax=Mesorhizobium sp. B2-8-3 TaxID=2589905 RepID=UPI00112B6AEF|nr:tyrosine-type recombinase/integrase [Mesorhizobium sp. B2-8-3]TPJ33701.1 hypothetical protein FJ418_13815 [Mesorhizobium sp. B2-8-3]